MDAGGRGGVQDRRCDRSLAAQAWGYYLLVVLVVGAIPVDVYHLIHHHTWTSAILLGLNVLLLAILIRYRHFLLARETRSTFTTETERIR
ncbi:MAG: DUF2127 domain-containing protein [Actinomycetota bacterium]